MRRFPVLILLLFATVPVFAQKLETLAATGYYETGTMDFGPYYQTLGYNEIEGLRLGLGLRTGKLISRTVRVSGYGAYGFRDHRWKGGLTTEFMFGNDPWRKLTLSARHDLAQLGTAAQLRDNAFFNSLLARSTGRRLTMVDEYRISYDHEMGEGFFNSLSAEHSRIYGNAYVPMVRPDGIPIARIDVDQVRYQARLSWEEAVSRGVFDLYVYPTRYPVLTLEMNAGRSTGNHFFFRPEVSVDWRIAAGGAGTGRLHTNSGWISGKVPYPLLKLHEANNTFLYDRNSFACMAYYEFASDFWTDIFYEHDFGGILFRHVPLFRKCREMVALKGAWGGISRKNRGEEALLLLPEGTSPLDKPYLEASVGIDGLLRIIRIDISRRLTLSTGTSRDWAVTVGFRSLF